MAIHGGIRVATVDGCHFFLIDYDEEMDDGYVREETPTDSRSQDCDDLHQVRSGPKGFRRSRLALPRAPQRETYASSQPAVLRTKHRVMETIIVIVLVVVAFAITMKGD